MLSPLTAWVVKSSSQNMLTSRLVRRKARRQECKNLVLNYDFVCRDHAVIIHEGSSLVVLDQGTKHVRLKGTLVDWVTRQPGDVFYIANVAITFHKL